jgi:DinB family protein
MKRILILAILAAAAPALASAQQNAPLSNPVSNTVKNMVAQRAKAIIAGADEMPADKYSYHPTPDQMTFGHLIMHLAQSNNFLCSAIAGTKPPEQEKLADTDSKDKLVTALKSSFDYCSGVLDKATDANLGEMVSMFRGQAPRARVMVGLVADLYDHYSQEAAYLRMNGLTPPSAQGGRGRM